MYKDKDRQREANAERQRRYKEKQKALLNEGVTVTKCESNVGVTDISAVSTIVSPEHTAQGNIRVSKPGDGDYVPQCETTRAFIEGRDKRPETGKRGKDIKVFADLPPDVQQTIDSLSMVDGKICQRVKANRTAIAINYQHLFPDRFHSTGVAV